MSTKTARVATRDDPADRTPNRDAPERDPNKIYSRSGREVSLRFTGDEDRFDLAKMGVYPPDGWDYQWKTRTIKNWEWADHQVELYQNGWEPVPASRHDGLIMPKGHEGNIERGGQILMERPMRLTIQARQIERRAAVEKVNDSRSMAGLMGRHVPGISPDSMDFSNPAARQSTGVRVSRETAPAVRNDPGYRYTVDEE